MVARGSCRYSYFPEFGRDADDPLHRHVWNKEARLRSGLVSFTIQTTADSAIETLSSKQRAHLRSLAHHLKPVLHIGKDGITKASISAAMEAFNTRELVKLRVLESAPHKTHDAAELLAAELDGARVVQVIGRTAVLYRRDPDRPRIELP